MTDTLPNKIKPQECGIVNMDSDGGIGTHFTAYIKQVHDIVYFDSYGNLPSSIELVEYFRSDGSKPKITYNYDVIQNFNSYSDSVEMCLSFTLTGTSSAIYLEYEIGLANFDTFNMIPNIEETTNTFKYGYKNE